MSKCIPNTVTINKKSINRIYGSAPGAYGAGLQGLIDNNNWDNRNDLGEAYLSWSQRRYDGCKEPVKDITGLKNSLNNVKEYYNYYLK